MRGLCKRIICVCLSFVLLFSLVGCEEDKPECQVHMEEFLDAVIARKSKVLRRLTDLSDAHLYSVRQMEKDEFISEVMKHVTYKIDTDSISMRTRRASCECSISVPNYEEAFYSCDGTLENFGALLDALPPEKYNTYDYLFRFEIEDGYWTVINADQVYPDIYVKLYAILSGVESKQIIVEDGPDGPANTSLEFKRPDKIFTIDLFKDALKHAGDGSDKNYTDLDHTGSNADSRLTGYSFNKDQSVMYQFFSYSSDSEGRKAFEDLFAFYSSMKDVTNKTENDWGYYIVKFEDGGEEYCVWYRNIVIDINCKSEANASVSLWKFFRALTAIKA